MIIHHQPDKETLREQWQLVVDTGDLRLGPNNGDVAKDNQRDFYVNVWLRWKNKS